MNKILKIIHKKARALQLPCTYIPELGSLRIILGKMHYYFTFTLTPLNNASSVYIANNKHLFNKLLAKKGFPTPKGVAINDEALQSHSLNELIKDLNFPLTAKPMIGGKRGDDVLCNIKDIDALNTYLQRMLKQYKYILVEEFITHLKEYRALVLKNKVIGVVERFAASVIGDGKQTIQELIDEKNKERSIFSKVMTHAPIVYDEEYKICLEEQGLTLKSIPPQNKKIQLCYTVNLGRGGDIFSLGRTIHPENERLICQAVRKTGLNYAGMDVLCEDINIPFKPNKWFLLEANFYPDITLHEVPQDGEKASVVRPVLAQLIYRHPFSYLFYLCRKSRFSKYLNGLLFLIFIVLIFYFKPTNGI